MFSTFRPKLPPLYSRRDFQSLKLKVKCSFETSGSTYPPTEPPQYRNPRGISINSPVLRVCVSRCIFGCSPCTITWVQTRTGTAGYAVDALSDGTLDSTFAIQVRFDTIFVLHTETWLSQASALRTARLQSQRTLRASCSIYSQVLELSQRGAEGKVAIIGNTQTGGRTGPSLYELVCPHCTMNT
jgi:hypothetical protein